MLTTLAVSKMSILLTVSDGFLLYYSFVRYAWSTTCKPHRSLVMFATALLHQDLSFYPSMGMLGPRPSHTHYMVPFAPLGRCPCSVKPRPCVIPDVTCIILVHTTNTADKITTTPLLDSTLSPCPPPVDHRGGPLSHTFNID